MAHAGGAGISRYRPPTATEAGSPIMASISPLPGTGRGVSYGSHCPRKSEDIEQKGSKSWVDRPGPRFVAERPTLGQDQRRRHRHPLLSLRRHPERPDLIATVIPQARGRFLVPARDNGVNPQVAVGEQDRFFSVREEERHTHSPRRRNPSPPPPFFSAPPAAVPHLVLREGGEISCEPFARASRHHGPIVTTKLPTPTARPRSSPPYPHSQNHHSLIHPLIHPSTHHSPINAGIFPNRKDLLCTEYTLRICSRTRTSHFAVQITPARIESRATLPRRLRLHPTSAPGSLALTSWVTLGVVTLAVGSGRVTWWFPTPGPGN